MVGKQRVIPKFDIARGTERKRSYCPLTRDLTRYLKPPCILNDISLQPLSLQLGGTHHQIEDGLVSHGNIPGDYSLFVDQVSNGRSEHGIAARDFPLSLQNHRES